jgi:hypothetical protein
MLDHSCQGQRHSHAERGLDLYETPNVAVEALLRVEQIPQRIWEPAAGKGAIVRVLRDHGHAVMASDIYDYGGLDFVGDFLGQERMPAGCEAIVTNPPYKIAESFVAYALDRAPLVIMLLRLAFLESERRCHILGLQRSRSCPRIPQALADDAPRGVAGAQSKQRHGFRLVRVDPQLHRPDAHRSYFMGKLKCSTRSLNNLTRRLPTRTPPRRPACGCISSMSSPRSTARPRRVAAESSSSPRPAPARP